MDERFVYVLVVPDHPMDDFTPTAGFSPGLLGFEWAPQRIATLPVDVWEPALSPVGKTNRKACGQGGYRWLPLGLLALQQIPFEALGPLVVLFTNDEPTSASVQSLVNASEPKPLHVSRTPMAGALRPDQIDRAVLKRFAEAWIRTMPEQDRGALLEALRKWPAQKFRRSSLRYRSHNVTLANEMVLLSEGFLPSEGKRLNPIDDRDYVKALRDTTLAVRRLRSTVTLVPAERAFPQSPDLILFAPAMFRGRYQRARAVPDLPQEVHRSFRMLQRQTGYAFRTELAADAAVVGSPVWAAINTLRSQELRIQSAGVGLMATSTLAAALRLPAGVNRTSGVISAIADHLRAHPGSERKTGRVFQAVQNALTEAIDPALIKLIGSATKGVRIVADAPIEWLPIDGLPLMFRLQSSRIGATPGNLSFGELVNSDPMMLSNSALDDVLHIRAFEATDPIRGDMERALAAVAVDARVSVRCVDVQSRAELVDALNGFQGALAIFDAHGTHEWDRPAELIIGRDRVDAWSLRGEARIPPLVVLSACDTHAVDGSHATVANGLVASGAKAVLATFLPVRSDDSSALVARLILGARGYVRALNDQGRSVSWARVITYGLRAQLISDVLRRLTQELGLDPQTFIALSNTATARVNLGESDWWERFRVDVAQRSSWEPERLDRFLQNAIAGSDVIRYVHVGAPESVVLTSPQVFAKLADRHRRAGRH